MSQILYSGPGKVYFNSKSLQAQGENGNVKIDLQEATSPIAQAMIGRLGENYEDSSVKISTTPFDDYSLLPTLFPTFLGVSTPSNTGILKIGALAHTGSNLPVVVWCADLTTYSLVRGAITKHPDIMLGASTPLFGSTEITCIGDVSKLPGASAYLFGATPVAEPAAATADPDAANPFNMTNFIRERWTGAYGTISGGTVTGLTGFTALESQDFWTISVNAKYDTMKVQKITKHMKLASVEVVAKCKLVGPTHTQLVAQLGGVNTNRVSGSRMGVKPDGSTTFGLALTSQSGKVITLTSCEIKGAGITTGGTEIRHGEVGFVTSYTYGTAPTDPILIFA